MRLAVISDIHGNLIALETVLEAIDREHVDQIWVLGDLAAHGSRPAECVEVLRERHETDQEHFKVIGGNTDRYLVTNTRMPRPKAKDAEAYQLYVQQFQAENTILGWGQSKLGWENYEFLSGVLGKEVGAEVNGYGYVLGYHAIPGNDEYNITPDTPDEEVLDSVLDRPLRLGIYGHIHQQLDRDLGSVRLVNPGSVGMSFQSPGKVQFALFTFMDNNVTVDLREETYDVDAAIADLKAVGHPLVDEMAKMLRTGAW